MRQHFTTAAAATAGLLLMPLLASAKCNNIDLVSRDGVTAIDPASVSSDTPQSDQRPLRVSKYVNCTAQAGANADCPVERYPLALPLEPAIRHADVDDEANIFAIVRAAANPDLVGQVNFNETIRFNYTLANETVPQGMAGYYNWYAHFRCWEGTLRDCEGDDDDVDGRNVTACGLMWEDGTRDLPVDQQKYQGEVVFLQTDNDDDDDDDPPYPRASEFDWKDYEEDIKEENEENAQAPQGAAAALGDAGWLRMAGCGLGLSWGVVFLLI